MKKKPNYKEEIAEILKSEAERRKKGSRSEGGKAALTEILQEIDHHAKNSPDQLTFLTNLKTTLLQLEDYGREWVEIDEEKSEDDKKWSKDFKETCREFFKAVCLMLE